MIVTEHEQLTPAELIVLEQARELGYLFASGQRLQVWRRHRDQCRRDGVPFITVQSGARVARVGCDLSTCGRLGPDIRRRLMAVANARAKHASVEGAKQVAQELIQLVQADGATLWDTEGADGNLAETEDGR